MLEANAVDYTISVPFERLLALKSCVEKRSKWHCLDDTSDFFEQRWKPKSWKATRRFIVVRQAAKRHQKHPVQLDLFVPYDYQWEFKKVLMNKKMTVEIYIKEKGCITLDQKMYFNWLCLIDEKIIVWATKHFIFPVIETVQKKMTPLERRGRVGFVFVPFFDKRQEIISVFGELNSIYCNWGNF